MARWVSRGFADGSRVVVASWCGQQQQALTSHFGGFTHGVGNDRVSFSLQPLTLSVLPLSPQVFFSFFLLFFRLETGVFDAGFTFLNLLSFFLFLHVGWPAELMPMVSKFGGGPIFFSFFFFLKINLLKKKSGFGKLVDREMGLLVQQLETGGCGSAIMVRSSCSGFMMRGRYGWERWGKYYYGCSLCPVKVFIGHVGLWTCVYSQTRARISFPPHELGSTLRQALWRMPLYCISYGVF